MIKVEHPIPGRCPVCTGPTFVERVGCDACGSAVEGRFALDWPHQLTREQLAFVKVFVSCRGKIKDVEEALGISYPTVVSRLDQVVEAVTGQSQPSPSPASERRLKILEDLAAGRIDLNQAEQKLRER